MNLEFTVIIYIGALGFISIPIIDSMSLSTLQAHSLVVEPQRRPGHSMTFVILIYFGLILFLINKAGLPPSLLSQNRGDMVSLSHDSTYLL